MPRNPDRYAVVQVQIEHDVARTLGKRAVAEDSSMASVIRRAVSLYLFYDGDPNQIRAGIRTRAAELAAETD